MSKALSAYSFSPTENMLSPDQYCRVAYPSLLHNCKVSVKKGVNGKCYRMHRVCASYLYISPGSAIEKDAASASGAGSARLNVNLVTHYFLLLLTARNVILV